MNLVFVLETFELPNQLAAEERLEAYSQRLSGFARLHGHDSVFASEHEGQPECSNADTNCDLSGTRLTVQITSGDSQGGDTRNQGRSTKQKER